MQFRPPALGPHYPTLLLAMHKRLESDRKNDGFVKSVSVAYDASEFQGFCTSLCQHRTLGSVIGRLSTAVFSCRTVTWEGSNDFGRSMGEILDPVPNYPYVQMHRVKKEVGTWLTHLLRCVKI